MYDSGAPGESVIINPLTFTSGSNGYAMTEEMLWDMILEGKITLLPATKFIRNQRTSKSPFDQVSILEAKCESILLEQEEMVHQRLEAYAFDTEKEAAEFVRGYKRA